MHRSKLRIVAAGVAISLALSGESQAAGRTTLSTRTTPAKSARSARSATIDPKALVLAVRAAATPTAAAAAAVLGPPSCPTGVKDVAGFAAQCVVAFDRVAVPYVVRRGSDGALVAQLAHPVHRRLDVERAASARTSAAVACGRDAILVVPDGAYVTCSLAKQPVRLRVARTGDVVAAD